VGGREGRKVGGMDKVGRVGGREGRRVGGMDKVVVEPTQGRRSKR
jgi:hypothetical protein